MDYSLKHLRHHPCAELEAVFKHLDLREAVVLVVVVHHLAEQFFLLFRQGFFQFGVMSGDIAEQFAAVRFVETAGLLSGDISVPELFDWVHVLYFLSGQHNSTGGSGS